MADKQPKTTQELFEELGAACAELRDVLAKSLPTSEAMNDAVRNFGRKVKVRWGSERTP